MAKHFSIIFMFKVVSSYIHFFLSSTASFTIIHYVSSVIFFSCCPVIDIPVTSCHIILFILFQTHSRSFFISFIFHSFFCVLIYHAMLFQKNLYSFPAIPILQIIFISFLFLPCSLLSCDILLMLTKKIGAFYIPYQNPCSPQCFSSVLMINN